MSKRIALAAAVTAITLLTAATAFAQPILPPLPPLFPKPTTTTTTTTTPTTTPPTSSTTTPAPPPPGAEKLPLATGRTDTRPGPRVFTLEASSMTLTGVRYGGVTPQQTVHLTVDGAEIGGLVQRALLGNGRVLTTSGSSVSTITGRTELFLEEFTGTLTVAGLPTVPVTLSGRSLLTPGVNLSFLSLPRLGFTGVTARVVAIDGGDLRVPGARMTLD